jgi:hypothetical protein
MNTDASAGVAIQGDLAAKVPLLPWVAGVLLATGLAFAVAGGWFLVRELRDANRLTAVGGGQLP